MKLAVYSLKRALFEGDAPLVNCKTAAGEITILNHHRALVATLAPGVMRITDTKGEDHYLNLAGGFIEVDGRNRVKAIVDEG